MLESEAVLEVITPGIQSLIQDLGRFGFASVGVATSGAYDRSALMCVNEALGNPAGTPGIECLLGGLELRAFRNVKVALVLPGQPSAELIDLQPGDTLTIPRVKRGLRSYLAIQGGLRVDSVLGSSSTDTMSGLGPAPLATGDVLARSTTIPADSGELADSASPTAAAQHRARRPSDEGNPRSDLSQSIDVIANLGTTHSTPGSVEALHTGTWTVSPVSSRVGMRLTGPNLGLAADGEHRSQPVICGTIQAPGGGELIILGPDGPTTGGYPVVGVVADHDLSRLGQLRPGEPISFTVRHNTAVSP